ncbi:MAG TPA: DUF2255 family protein [Microbacteriaceae bacterium]
MTAWTPDELLRVGDALELQITSERADGTMRPYVTIWVVQVGDGLYVRSAHGVDNPWFRRAKASGAGRIRAGGLERDVTFVAAEGDVHEAIDAAYHVKYDPHEPEFVAPVVGAHAAPGTLRLQPRSRDTAAVL